MLLINYTLRTDLYFMRASSFVNLLAGSKTPVSRFTLDTGFFNNPSPTFTRFSKFSLVAISTDASVPVNVSSCIFSTSINYFITQVNIYELEIYLNSEIIFFRKEGLKNSSKVKVNHVTAGLRKNIHQWSRIVTSQPSQDTPLCCLICIVLFFCFCCTSPKRQYQESPIVRGLHGEEVRAVPIDFFGYFTYSN